MIARLLAEADRLYLRSEAGIGVLPRRARMGIWAARLIYARIGTQVRRNACDSISVSTHASKAQKLGWMAKAGLWAAGDMIMPRSAVIYAPPLAETAFLVDAASRTAPSATGPRHCWMCWPICGPAKWLLEPIHRALSYSGHCQRKPTHGLAAFRDISGRVLWGRGHRGGVSDRNVVQKPEQTCMDPAELGISGDVDLDLYPDLFRGSRVAGQAGSAYAMAFWAAQIAFNALWTPVFFGARRLKGALLVMGALWVSVLGATIAHFQVDFWAGVMFVPYLIWVTIAGALNWEMVRLNPNAVPLDMAGL